MSNDEPKVRFTTYEGDGEEKYRVDHEIPLDHVLQAADEHYESKRRPSRELEEITIPLRSGGKVRISTTNENLITLAAETGDRYGKHVQLSAREASAVAEMIRAKVEHVSN